MFEGIIVLYYCYCLVYGSRSILKKRENGLIQTAVIVFLPILGIFVAHIMIGPNDNKKEHGVVATRKIETNPPSQEYYSKQSSNLISIQDALLLNNNDTKRELLLEMLKGNANQNTTILKKAIENNDSETSHYAATAMMEMQRETMNRLHQLTGLTKQNPNDSSLLGHLAETIKTYLDSGFGDVVINQRYQLQLSSTLEKLINSEGNTVQQFIDKLHCDMELADYDKMITYCQKFMEAYPDEEISYLTAMKIYYTLRMPEEIKKTASKLRRQSISLSIVGINSIRFWLQEENCESTF